MKIGLKIADNKYLTNIFDFFQKKYCFFSYIML